MACSATISRLAAPIRRRSAGVGEQGGQAGGQLGDVAGLVQPAVAARADQVRQRHRVGRDHRGAGGHRLQRGQALQLGDAGHAEHRGPGVGLDQLLLGDEPAEPDPVGQPELAGQRGPLARAGRRRR